MCTHLGLLQSRLEQRRQLLVASCLLGLRALTGRSLKHAGGGGHHNTSHSTKERISTMPCASSSGIVPGQRPHTSSTTPWRPPGLWDGCSTCCFTCAMNFFTLVLRFLFFMPNVFSSASFARRFLSALSADAILAFLPAFFAFFALPPMVSSVTRHWVTPVLRTEQRVAMPARRMGAGVQRECMSV